MKAERLLEEIKSKIDIVEFISDFVNLKKAGQNYKGLCPFHSEKTPSFIVSPVKQIFHCFGCGSGGDIVSFIMKQENLSFYEALQYLAKKAGIKLTEMEYAKDSAYKKSNQIYKINEIVSRFFTKNLFDSENALKYITNRGITKDSISKFNIGYAPDSRNSLFIFLKKQNITENQMLEAGLIVRDNQGFRDIFRKRIIFPILNMKNDIVAFGGRVMDNTMPKYLNSPETPVFKKSDNLFAVNIAKDYIRKNDCAIIVEGYMDTIICHQFGINNVVAPLGTALTYGHLQKLKVLTRNVLLVFDGDEAGISAARRALNTVFENDFRAKVIILTSGDDPDSFLRKNGEQKFRESIDNALSAIEFLFKTSKNTRTEKVREIIPMIANIKDHILADELLSELADRSGIHENLLRSETEKIRNKKINQIYTKTSSYAQKTIYAEEELLLSAILSAPDKIPYILSRLEINDLKDEIIKSLFSKIKKYGSGFNTDRLLSEANDDEKVLISELLINPGFDIQLIDENIKDCLLRIEQRKFDERRINELTRKPDDVKLHNLMLKEKRKLIRGNAK
jgi:DNA primase